MTEQHELLCHFCLKQESVAFNLILIKIGEKVCEPFRRCSHSFPDPVDHDTINGTGIGDGKILVFLSMLASKGKGQLMFDEFMQ